MNAAKHGATASSFQLPLGRVALCLDCDTCFDVTTDRCPACGSQMWALAARFLGRRQ